MSTENTPATPQPVEKTFELDPHNQFYLHDIKKIVTQAKSNGAMNAPLHVIIDLKEGPFHSSKFLEMTRTAFIAGAEVVTCKKKPDDWETVPSHTTIPEAMHNHLVETVSLSSSMRTPVKPLRIECPGKDGHKAIATYQPK